MDKAWITIGLGTLGFLLTWSLMLFQAGRAVGQVRGLIKEEVDAEREARVRALELFREELQEALNTHEHRFGEVGAALREKISQVEEYIREVEIWGRDHYAQKPDMEKMIDQMRSDLKEAVGEIKKDMRSLLEKNRLQ